MLIKTTNKAKKNKIFFISFFGYKVVYDKVNHLIPKNKLFNSNILECWSVGMLVSKSKSNIEGIKTLNALLFALF